LSRQPSKKPRPKPSPTVVVANKQKAAIGQLESAILLWFNEADPISILVLASHAHDCYHALGNKIGKPSWYQEFADKMPCSFRERAKYVQDFAKHGFMDLDESTPFESIWADGLMLISIDRHVDIFGPPMRPLMALYYTRVLSEHPTWNKWENIPQIIIDSGIIDDVAQGNRKECLDTFLPRFKAIHAAFA